MATKKERIVRFTGDALKAMEARGETGSDWARAATMPVPDGSDPDDAIEPVHMDWVTTKLPMARTKEQLTLRVDADVLDWFRAQGRGYQTTINAILRQYFEAQRR
jgi:uncharacterized protein (DUF4415 family)